MASPPTTPRRRPLQGTASIHWGLSTILVTSILYWWMGIQSSIAQAKSASLLTTRFQAKWTLQSSSPVKLSQQLSVDPTIKCFDADDLISAIKNHNGPTSVPQEIRIIITPNSEANGIGFSLYWKEQYQSQRILQSIPKKCKEQIAFVAVALIVAIDNAIPPDNSESIPDNVPTESTPHPPIGNPQLNGASETKSPAPSQQSKRNRSQAVPPSLPTSQTIKPQVSVRRSTKRRSAQDKNSTSSKSQEKRRNRKQGQNIRRQQKQLLRQQQQRIREQLRMSRIRPSIKDAWLYTGGFVSYGLLPQFSGGAHLDFDINWSTPLNLHAGLLFNHGTQQKIGHGRADITLAAAELALCAAINEGWIQANFCLAAASGPVIARGTSFDENRLDVLPWVSASGQIRLRIDFSSRWGLLVHSAVYMPIVRLRLVIDGESQTRISFPRLGGLISIGPTFRFAK